MRDVKTYILEPGEYTSKASMRTLPSGQMLPSRGILITKDGDQTWVPVGHNVDEGCRIQLKWSGKGYGKVKHLTSTPRRKYHMALMWFSLILWAASWIFTIIEVVGGNKAVGDSRTNYCMLTAFTAWMGLVIVVLRNDHGFRKWFMTIFSYIVMLISIGSMVFYLVRLIAGY